MGKFRLREKSIEIEGTTFLIRELTFKESCQLAEETSKIDPISLKIENDITKFRILRLKMMIKDPEMTYEEVESLPENISTILTLESEEWLPNREREKN